MLGRVTVALFFLLLVWGNLVAGMKAGLACPDWPLCQGRLLPPLRLDVWMEFLHRVIAAVATLCLLPLAWRRLRSYRWGLRAVPLAAIGVLAAEIIIGGLVVLLELPVQLTTVHFMMGLTIFMLALFMAIFDEGEAPAAFHLRGYAGLFAGMGALLFSQAALGAYVRHSQAGLACPDFPTCLGSWMPPTFAGPPGIHFAHRVAALLIVGSFAALLAATFRDPRLKGQRAAACMLLSLGIVQIGAGAGVVQSGLHHAATAIHLAVALAMLLLLARMWQRELSTGGDVP